jgi:hypothetical protein
VPALASARQTSKATHISLLDMMDMIRVDSPVLGQLTAITVGSASVF